jgi:hypothetical protein
MMLKVIFNSAPHPIVTLANDAWFGDSHEPWLHLALARLRALEHRRFVVRATNSGEARSSIRRGVSSPGRGFSRARTCAARWVS